MIDQSDSLPLSEQEKRLLDKTPDSERQAKLQLLQERLATLTDTNTPEPHVGNALPRARIALEMAGIYLDLDNKLEAWNHARPTVEIFIAHGLFEDATMSCQYVYLAEQSDAITAIGQAAWLAVTYPVDPHLSANVLSHIIDETPDDSDGAAVAAATAHYLVDLRASEKQREELILLAPILRESRNDTPKSNLRLSLNYG